MPSPPQLPPALDRPVGGWIHAVSIPGGVLISFFILWGIAQAQKTALPEATPVLQELRAMADDDPPPPPPPRSSSNEPPPPSPLDLELQPTSGGIPIVATVATFAPPQPRLPEIRFDLEVENYKPSTDGTYGRQRDVYQVEQVDRRPVVLYRKSPKFYQAAIARLENPYVELMFVVSVNGLAEDIEVLHAPTEELADATVEAVREWKFRPAMNGGVRVRCLVRQTVNLSAQGSSPFSVR